MLQKNAHEISASEAPMVKSYDLLKSGYSYGENVKTNQLFRCGTDISGWLVDADKRIGLLYGKRTECGYTIGRSVCP